MALAKTVRSIQTQLPAREEAIPKGVEPGVELHPFDLRNIHPKLPNKVRTLFDDGHCAEATFEAVKYVEKEIQRLSGQKKQSGFSLMMVAFSETNGSVKLTACSDQSEIDEQLGYKFLFSGLTSAVRNPRGHEYGVEDDPDLSLDHLGFISMLLRRLEDSGHSLTDASAKVGRAKKSRAHS